KITGTHVQHIEAGNFVQLLLHVVQADDWPRLLSVLSADTAESHRILYMCCRNGRCVRVCDALLILPKVLALQRLGHEQIDCPGSLKSLGERGSVLHIGDEYFSAARGERFEFLRVASDDA